MVSTAIHNACVKENCQEIIWHLGRQILQQKLALVILRRDTMGFFQQQFGHGWPETDMINALLTTTGNKYLLYCKMRVTVICCSESIIQVEHSILPYKKFFTNLIFWCVLLLQIHNLKQDNHTITLLLYLCIVESNPKPQWKWIIAELYNVLRQKLKGSPKFFQMYLLFPL